MIRNKVNQKKTSIIKTENYLKDNIKELSQQLTDKWTVISTVWVKTQAWKRKWMIMS